jgi:hypothetical protein
VGGRRAALLLATLAAASIGAGAGDADSVLTGVERTDHFDIRFRPGSRAAASVERTAVMAERDFARISSALKLKPEGRFVLYLYDDVAQLARITGTTGNGGFSAGNQSHIPFDNDQTRLHEMVHILAVQIPKAGDEPRSLFFAEGLANAVLEFVDGVPVHAVAAFHRKRGELPPLAELAGAKDFYGWLRAHPGFDAYDVGASWFRHLLDTFGPEKVKRYYAGLPAAKAFGADEASLEAAWHRALDAYALRPEVETLLRQRAGEAVAFAADEAGFAEVLGRLEEWTSLDAAEVRPGDAAAWTRKDGALEGRGDGGSWRVCELGTGKHGDCAVRATVAMPSDCGAIQVRLGDGCQAMLVANGAFVWRDAGGTARNPAVRLPGRSKVDLLLVRRGGKAEVWVDGRLAVGGPCGADPAPVGVGFVNGTAVFSEVRVRDFRRDR